LKGNRLISKIIMVVIFLVGFGFILYPIVANEWNEICRRKVITVYDRQVEQSVKQGKISYEDEKRKADEYNKALRFNITDDGFVSNNDNSVNNSDNDTDEDNNKDNEGHIFVCLQNESDKEVVIKKGDRFVQGIFMSYLITDDDCATDTRNGGIGSTNEGDDNNE